MPYEGCQIAVFTDDQSSHFDRFMQESAVHGMKAEEIERQRVAVFQRRFEEDMWPIFVAHPLKNVLIVATNREYLQEVLARIRGDIGQRALPETLPEWKHVNRKAKFWGLRHFNKGDAGADPSSPFGGKRTANMPDELAIGLTFEGTPNEQQSATIRYLSANPEILRMVEANLFPANAEPAETRGLQSRYRDVGPDAVEGSFTLDHFDPVNYFSSF